MQINRLFEIVYILLDKKTATARELSERFEVSSRTIYRDVETLSAAGIPIYMSKGKGGGISLLPDFVLNKTVLTDGEKQNILSSLQAVNAVNLSGTDTALHKLSTFFGGADSDWIEVDFSSWANGKEETERFNTIKAAILNRRIISFKYSGTDGQRTLREAEPLKLCFKSSAWYLYGYCRLRGAFRFFKLSRIRDLCKTDESFQRETPKQVFSQESGFQDDFVQLKLWLSPQMAYRVYDEFDTCQLREDGSFIAEITYPRGEWIYYYVATFGSHCEVIEPADIREAVAAELKKTLDRYL